MAAPIPGDRVSIRAQSTRVIDGYANEMTTDSIPNTAFYIRTSDRMRHLFASAVAWDMSDHADRPDLRQQREKCYAQFDQWHARVKAEAADRARRTSHA